MKDFLTPEEIQDEGFLFHNWQIEHLLNQAAELADKCLSEYKELKSIEMAFNQLNISLDDESEKLKLDRKQLSQLFRKNHDITQHRVDFLKLQIYVIKIPWTQLVN
ncbi:hypothetical protein [Dyadobacter sp. NIV53]|uniref:hypothetical protein n=1 Tax=Dyadobacter sp. NIV53 TaxID=2861765 RepID=UPI001C87CF21|nr:hypothetical protein [Dyadobacter sp. NIV53]